MVVVDHVSLTLELLISWAYIKPLVCKAEELDYLVWCVLSSVGYQSITCSFYSTCYRVPFEVGYRIFV